jgi:NADH pyrophosphatase NudC (nudix superfamily)
MRPFLKLTISIFMVWKPHVTVAAIVEHQQKYLLVEENVGLSTAFNQPAGHLEPGESLIEAVKREVQEETAWQFEPESLVTVQLWRKNSDAPSFLRFTFCGTVHSHNPTQKLDTGILSTHWFSHAEIIARADQMRSPLVLLSVDEYLKGIRFPLSLLQNMQDIT